MILYRYDSSGGQRYVDITDMYKNETAMIVGGSPSLKNQPEITELLTSRVNNLVTFGINNVARTFKTDYTVFIDDPACIDPIILMDPTIIKITNDVRKNNKIPDYNIALRDVPGMMFFNRSSSDKSSALFSNKTLNSYKSNSLITAIVIAAAAGFKNIILAGSDFNLTNNTDDEQYITGKKLNELELKWNRFLFSSQIEFIKTIEPVLKSLGVKIYDSSFNSNKLSPIVERIDADGIRSLLLNNKPSTITDNLPHCSKFASEQIINAVLASGDIKINDDNIDAYSIGKNKDFYSNFLNINTQG
jgi:hypothetical protein